MKRGLIIWEKIFANYISDKAYLQYLMSSRNLTSKLTGQNPGTPHQCPILTAKATALRLSSAAS